MLNHKRLLPYQVSPLAEEDILSLRLFLETRNEIEAFPLILERIQKAIILLRQFPNMGEYRADFSARVLVIPQTRFSIIFRVKKDTLEILRIYHTSQKWEDAHN